MSEFEETTKSFLAEREAQVRSFGRSHVGMVRELNEDAYLDRSQTRLWIVADGVGGWARGDIASRTTIEQMSMLELPANAEIAAEAISGRLQAVNDALLRESRSRGGRGMATTVVSLCFRDSRALLHWAGDSRIYRLRHGRLERLTRDHSKVQAMVDAGTITEEQAANHPEANVITRALGAFPHVQIDQRFEVLEDGDVFLLCSDGLTKHVSDGELARIIATEAPEYQLDRMLNLALSRGGTDNVTAVIVHVDKVRAA